MVDRKITSELVSVYFAVNPTTETEFVVTGDDLLTNLWSVRSKRYWLGI